MYLPFLYGMESISKANRPNESQLIFSENESVFGNVHVLIGDVKS